MRARKHLVTIAVAGWVLFAGSALGYLVVDATPAAATTSVTLYVATSGVGDCSTQVGACGTIQTAINTAESGSYSGDDVTINVAVGRYTENDLVSAASIHSLTIAGAGVSSTTVSGGGAGTVFQVSSGSVTFSGLTITRGQANSGGGINIAAGTVNLTSSLVSGNAADNGGNGGGIDNAGTLTITSSTVSGNSAGNGISGGNGGNGGGIENVGTLTIVSSAVSGNIAGNGASGSPNGGSGGNGGGIENNGTLSVSASTVTTGNRSGSGGFSDGAENGGISGSGGGIENAGTLDVSYSSVSGNSTPSGCDCLYGGGNAGNGGAVDIASGTVNVTNSTIAGNSAGNGGVGESGQNYGGTGGSGGGFDNAGTLNITSSTLSGNSAGSSVAIYGTAGNGGGIENAGALTVVSSTFSANTTGPGDGGFEFTGAPGMGGGIYGNAVLAATIMSKGALGGNCSGAVTDEGYNIADDASCGFSAAGSVSSSETLDSSLGILSNNGGPTQTILPTSSSPAVWVIPNATTLDGVQICPAIDQRGVSSAPGGDCNIGAIQDALLRPSIPTMANLPLGPVFGASFTATVATTGDGVASVSSSTSSVCTTVGLAVHFTGVGTCTLTAHVAVGINYGASDGSPQSFTVSQANPTTPTISNLPSSASFGSSFSAVVSTDGDGLSSVTSTTPAVCTATGLAVNFIGPGSCALTAHVAVGTYYSAADGSPQTFTVSRATPANPTISNLPSLAYLGGSFTASVTTNGDGVYSVTSSTPAVCGASNLTVAYLAAGTCILTAHVGVGTNYLAADGTSQSFTVLGLTVGTTPLPSASPGTSYVPVSLTALGVRASASPLSTKLKWAKVSLLPKGLKLSSTGVLSGTPSSKLSPAMTSITVQVTETVTTFNGKKKVTTKTTVQGTIPLNIT